MIEEIDCFATTIQVTKTNHVCSESYFWFFLPQVAFTMCAIASPLNYVVLEQPRQLVGADKFWNLSRSMLPVMKKLQQFVASSLVSQNGRYDLTAWRF